MSLCLKPLKEEEFDSLKEQKEYPVEVGSKKVGSGSYNVVYEGVGKKGCRDVGKKVIFRRTKKRIESKKSFINESKMAIRMSDARAGPAIYMVGLDEKKRGFMIMDYFPTSLRELMDAKKPPSWSRIEESLRKPIRKMAQRGIFCSDLKFRNVVVKNPRRNMVCKIIDFGDDFCSFRSQLVVKGSGKPSVDVLYLSMLIMMSINSEKTRKKRGEENALFSKEISNATLKDKIDALLLIQTGKSETGRMAKPINQAKHYYKGSIKDSKTIYEIITRDTFKK